VHVSTDAVPTMAFDWGFIKWFVTPSTVEGAGSTFGEVIVNPGRGHARHNHPDAEEILYVISGEAVQTVADGEPFAIKEGDTVHIPAGAYHSTFNATWRPLRLIVTYTPGGEEKALEGAPDLRVHEAGTVAEWRQA
jgi:oxalate decarboxylase/phosphoglucose isomerase-like protein (cupin superfamily)